MSKTKLLVLPSCFGNPKMDATSLIFYKNRTTLYAGLSKHTEIRLSPNAVKLRIKKLEKAGKGLHETSLGFCRQEGLMRLKSTPFLTELARYGNEKNAIKPETLKVERAMSGVILRRRKKRKTRANTEIAGDGLQSGI